MTNRSSVRARGASTWSTTPPLYSVRRPGLPPGFECGAAYGVGSRAYWKCNIFGGVVLSNAELPVPTFEVTPHRHYRAERFGDALARKPGWTLVAHLVHRDPADPSRARTGPALDAEFQTLLRRTRPWGPALRRSRARRGRGTRRAWCGCMYTTSGPPPAPSRPARAGSGPPATAPGGPPVGPSGARAAGRRDRRPRVRRSRPVHRHLGARQSALGLGTSEDRPSSRDGGRVALHFQRRRWVGS